MKNVGSRIEVIGPTPEIEEAVARKLEEMLRKTARQLEQAKKKKS